jgi:ADP-ribose pyrophosphatase YjhB (NUDIX family)
VHYQNPKLVVGTLPVWQDQILLCRRAIEPRHGYWTLPAGFMENGESTQQGALRESQEEAGLEIELQQLLSVIDLPQHHQVHLFFLARMTSPTIVLGEETLEAQLFAVDDIPWHDLAFQTVEHTLRFYVQHRDDLTHKQLIHTIEGVPSYITNPSTHQNNKD